MRMDSAPGTAALPHGRNGGARFGAALKWAGNRPLFGA
jgi:hypothetical protein